MFAELFFGTTAITVVLIIKWVGDLDMEIKDLEISNPGTQEFRGMITKANSALYERWKEEKIEKDEELRKEMNKKIYDSCSILHEVRAADAKDIERLINTNSVLRNRNEELDSKIDNLYDSLFVKDAFGLGFKNLFKFTAVEFERLVNDKDGKLEIVKRYTTPFMAKLRKENISVWKKEVETFRSIGGR